MAVERHQNERGHRFFLVAAFFLTGVAFFLAGAAFFLTGAAFFFLASGAFFFAGAAVACFLAGAAFFFAGAGRRPPTTLITPGAGMTVVWPPVSHSTVTSVPLTRRTTPCREPAFDSISTRSPTSAIDQGPPTRT